MTNHNIPGSKQNRNLDASGSPAPRTGIEREFAEREALDSALDAEASCWRDEVARRVNRYRTRHDRKMLAGEFSMKFEEPAPPPRKSAAPAVSGAVSAQVSAEQHGANLGHHDANLGHHAANHGAANAERPVAPAPAPARQPDLEPPVSRVAAAATASRTSSRPVPPPSAKSVAAVTRAVIQTEQALPADDFLAESVPEPAGVAPDVVPLPSSVTERRESKVIEFPRALMFPEEAAHAASSNDLAEPVSDASRIPDVPATVAVPAPPLADIALDADAEDMPARRPEFELPLRVAPLPHRFSAGIMDGVLVIAASAMFALIVALGAPGIPHTKPIMGMAAVLPMVFWTIYQYMFLTYSTCTPGMQMAGLRLSTFDGERPSWRLRRWRALMMVLSGASLGFGFLWALFDEDNLGWHDRMTSTYLTLERHQQ